MANRDNPHGLAPLGRTLRGGFPSVRAYARDADGNINAGGTPNTTTFQGVSLVYAAGSVAKTDILVVDSPDALYEAQDNDDTDGLAEADMGLMCDLEFNAGSAYSQISGHEIDESAAADTTTDLDVKLLRKVDVPDNAYGSHCRVEIVFNQHRLNPGMAGV